ncbi:MAG: aspartyl/asparaginyl beta-hydroxylase domain-containing protein [Steroidobacteraceae bacterium]
MAANPTNLPAVTAAGFAALNRGDPNAARALFDQAVSAGVADAAVWYGLARTHRVLGAAAEESAALDKALGLDAQFLPALLARGDWFARRGDRRAADSFYSVAIKVAAGMPSLPPEWRAEVRRVEASSSGFTREYEAHLLAALSAAGLGTPGTERFGHAIDLLLGKRQIFLQQPKYFFFPELPQIQFFERQLFPWASALERAVDDIRAEAREVLEAGDGFVPYLQRDPGRPTFDPRGLLDNPNWGAYFLIKNGATVDENAARCPRTFAVVEDLPLCRIDGRTPSVLFSLLRPGARIPPHHGFMNARLIVHLPLIVPGQCALRVGNETRAWREGELLIFDDSIEHEAWNSSQEPRIVLILDVWRPELTAKERDLVAAMLAAIDQFDGQRREWTD